MREPDNRVRINGVQIRRRAGDWLDGRFQPHRALNEDMGLSEQRVVGSREDFFQLGVAVIDFFVLRFRQRDLPRGAKQKIFPTAALGLFVAQ